MVEQMYRIALLIQESPGLATATFPDGHIEKLASQVKLDEPANIASESLRFEAADLHPARRSTHSTHYNFGKKQSGPHVLRAACLWKGWEFPRPPGRLPFLPASYRIPFPSRSRRRGVIK